ncbi:sensor domain-containing phosphodiesterase [Leucothrix mucor]|uniref:sensor domain-containing phosphodiesterase n=1 Tax=Leucothrix mucor TaxID=45248 RepID=UPI0003B6B61E|nr:EAL domain-containing protein [Leucothrix mucor]
MDKDVSAKTESEKVRLENKVIKTDLQYLVGLVRAHLNLDIAFIAKYEKGQRVFLHIDSKTEDSPIKPDDSDPFEQTYCYKITQGELPEIINDTSANPITRGMAVTKALDIKSYIGVPIRTADGKLFGTFCCIGHQVEPALSERDLAFIKVFAEFAGKQIDQTRQQSKDSRIVEDKILAMIESLDFEIAFQPIYNMNLQRVVGYEALSRFPGIPYNSPDYWFKEASDVGLGEVLEALTTKKALSQMDLLPENTYLSLNASPEYIINGSVGRLLEQVSGKQIVLEITEHARISNYDALRAALLPLRAKGIRLAIDDAGAGYASFQHILELGADIIKLDISLIRNIDKDSARRALTSAMISFAKNTDCEIIAEGVETAEELETLCVIGVSKAQGYFIGRPMSTAQIAESSAFTMPPEISKNA